MNRENTKRVERIVFTKANLRDIWALLEKIAQADIGGKAQNPTITVSSTGGVRTQSDNESIFDRDVIDLKKTISLQFSYANYHSSKSVSISLRAGTNSWGEDGFSVSGNDQGWVEATFVELEALFASFTPQFDLLFRFKLLIKLVLSTSVGISMAMLWLWISPPSTTVKPDPWVKFASAHPPLLYLLALAICAIWGAIPGDWLFAKLEPLWPSIEFDFGPEHLKRHKQQRKTLAFVGVVFLLPVLIEAAERFVFQ